MLFRERTQPSSQNQPSLFDQARAALLLLWRLASPEKRRRARRNRRKARRAPLCGPLAGLQPLEARLLLTGPTANPETYYDTNNGTISIPAYAGVLANDTGGNGPLSAVLVSGPSDGTLTLNSDGSFDYTNTMFPDWGMDSFEYEAFDGTTYSAPTTDQIDIFDQYQPTVQPQNYSVVHDHTLTVSAADGVLAGATDPNNIDLTAVLTSAPVDGTVQLNSDGSFSYTPDADFDGTDVFSFEAYDGNFYSAASTATINVTDQAPTATTQIYGLPTGQTLSVPADQGVLVGASDPDGDSLTAVLASPPSNGTLTLNSDGSFTYTPNAGFLGDDSFEYEASDGILQSQAEPVTLQTDYSVLSAVDETKVPLDTIHVSRQILSDPTGDQAVTSPLPAGGSGGTTISAAPADGAPATAHNLSLVYDSVLAQPDQVIEATLGLSTNQAATETITATLTFNGVAQPAQYFSMSSLNGTASQVQLAQQIDTSGMASGRYPWSLTVTSPDMQSPATISGAVNVVNDSASPFGKGWDMRGLLRLFNNTVSGVPAGVLLSTGDGNAYYYTQNEDGSYTAPAGAYAFSTFSSLTGGGWQLTTHEGVTFTFNSSGYLISRNERTGQTTTYTWSGDELTAITDAFGRSVVLSYTDGLLSSIQDYAGNVWQFTDNTDGELTSITDPTVAAGSPAWQYAYSSGYMTGETDPNGNESQFVLDGFHRLAQTDMPDDSTTGDVSEQDFGSGSTSSSDPANLTLATSVMPTTTDAEGNTSSYQTDQFGNITSETDAAGNTTTIQRDDNGLATVITLPPPAAGDANPVTDIDYDSTGDETYATGAQPTYGTFTYTADSFGQWATFTDSLGNEWVRTFDASGNILTETDPSGAEVSWTYDSYGQPLTMTVPAPNDGGGTVATHYYYNSDDLLAEILWPDGTNEQFGYNADDYETSSQDEDGNVTAQSRDALNQVVSVTNAAGGVTSTTYDLDGNVLSTETPMGQVTSDEYNSMNELVQETLPAPAAGDASPVLSFTYNLDGDKLTSTDAMGRETVFDYNDLNQLVKE